VSNKALLLTLSYSVLHFVAVAAAAADAPVRVCGCAGVQACCSML